MHTDFLGVRIDEVTLDQAFEEAVSLVKKPGKHLIVTPNVEFIIKAQKDSDFRKILNGSDLSIPDSARFTWARAQLSSTGLKKILLWPLFFLGTIPGQKPFPVATGTDLMEMIVSKSSDYGFKIGLIGGQNTVAEKTRECLLKKYPKAQIIFAEPGGRVNEDGTSPKIEIPELDFLFVAFGQGKQEKWINNNKEKIDAKVFMGVGGAFDYLSGEVARAPIFMRRLGLEWLFRLIRQPWRIKRFYALVKFTVLILVH
jgi:N-acetylglucosaminyldiphosphoundecaprenol N-acetyl-beta-D-mannosaminyltransferase